MTATLKRWHVKRLYLNFIWFVRTILAPGLRLRACQPQVYNQDGKSNTQTSTNRTAFIVHELFLRVNSKQKLGEEKLKNEDEFKSLSFFMLKRLWGANFINPSEGSWSTCFLCLHYQLPKRWQPKWHYWSKT